MKARALALFAFAASLSLAHDAGAVPAPTPAPTGPLPTVPAAFVKSNDAFAADLYKRIATTKGNVFFSPASISTALAMTYAGARGDTATQMKKTLHFDLPDADLQAAFGALGKRLESPGTGKNPRLSVANRIFSQSGMALETPFVDVTRDRYAAAVGLLDFKGASGAARKTINAWVEDHTAKKIVDLIPEGVVNGDTRMVLANAIYFKGTWASQFKKSDTRDDPFFTTPSSSKKVPMMHQQLDAATTTTADATVLSLPYASSDPDRKLSMVVVLPKAKDGLAKVEAGLDGKTLATLGTGLSRGPVILSLPKFKTTFSTGLGETLAAMGMPAAFDPAKANFTGITKSESLFITKVLHKAFVDVNEEGTEAAAATAVVVGTESAAVPPKPVTFTADHPFLFLIRDDKTGAVLFLGRIADPTAS